MKIALIQQHATKDKTANVAAVSPRSKPPPVTARSWRALPNWPSSGSIRNARPNWASASWPSRSTADGDGVPAEGARAGMVVVINLYEREGHHTFDSSPVIDADGTLLGVTRMIHITEYPCFHEQGYYTPGDKGAPVFKTKVGTVGVAICYDRHFPEYMRALAVHGADLVIVPQAGAVDEWPEGLYEAEMRVAAFQNGYFTALCNRVGKEDCLGVCRRVVRLRPDGEVLARGAKSADDIVYCDIDLVATASSNARRLFMKHRRPELYSGWIK